MARSDSATGQSYCSVLSATSFGTKESLVKPCVDCGLLTGCFATEKSSSPQVSHALQRSTTLSRVSSGSQDSEHHCVLSATPSSESATTVGKSLSACPLQTKSLPVHCPPLFGLSKGMQSMGKGSTRPVSTSPSAPFLALERRWLRRCGLRASRIWESRCRGLCRGVRSRIKQPLPRSRE